MFNKQLGKIPENQQSSSPQSGSGSAPIPNLMHPPPFLPETPLAGVGPPSPGVLPCSPLTAGVLPQNSPKPSGRSLSPTEAPRGQKRLGPGKVSMRRLLV